MRLLDWLRSKLGKEKGIPLSGTELEAAIESYSSKICIREMAFYSAVNVMANAISKCEFKTLVNGAETKASDYYLWNFEPNKNQNSSVFLHKMITMLYQNNECLVIEFGGQLLVADSYTKKENALDEDSFTDVAVGDFLFNKTFKQSNVLLFRLNERNMRQLINALYQEYENLISYGMGAFQKSRGQKLVYNYGTLPIAGTKEREAFDDLIKNRFKAFLQADNSVIPLGGGQELKEVGQRAYASETSRDIRAMIDDISDFTAKAFGIHPALLRGDVEGTSDALDHTLTFAVDPLVDMMQEEINRKRYGRDAVLKGTRIKIDTKAIKHVDLLSVSTAIDKLIGSGVFCVNDIRRLCGEEIIDAPWAWEHVMTKNYESIANALRSLKGGEEE